MTPEQNDLDAWRQDLTTMNMARRMMNEIIRQENGLAAKALSGAAFENSAAIADAKAKAEGLKMMRHAHDMMFEQGREFDPVPDDEGMDEIVKSPFDFDPGT